MRGPLLHFGSNIIRPCCLLHVRCLTALEYTHLIGATAYEQFTREGCQETEHFANAFFGCEMPFGKTAFHGFPTLCQSPSHHTPSARLGTGTIPKP